MSPRVNLVCDRGEVAVETKLSARRRPGARRRYLQVCAMVRAGRVQLLVRNFTRLPVMESTKIDGVRIQRL